MAGRVAWDIERHQGATCSFQITYRPTRSQARLVAPCLYADTLTGTSCCALPPCRHAHKHVLLRLASRPTPSQARLVELCLQADTLTGTSCCALPPGLHAHRHVLFRLASRPTRTKTRLVALCFVRQISYL